MDYEPPDAYERVVVEAAMEACEQAHEPDPWKLLHLVRIEEHTQLRPGLLAATWCIEASMRTETKDGGRLLGDRRGGQPMALGPMQLWPQHRRACGLSDEDAHDLTAAAWCYARRVWAVLPRAAAKCPKAAMRTAEAAVANIAKYRWSCHASSKHWQLAEEMVP